MALNSQVISGRHSAGATASDLPFFADRPAQHCSLCASWCLCPLFGLSPAPPRALAVLPAWRRTDELLLWVSSAPPPCPFRFFLTLVNFALLCQLWGRGQSRLLDSAPPIRAAFFHFDCPTVPEWGPKAARGSAGPVKVARATVPSPIGALRGAGVARLVPRSGLACLSE